MKSIKKPTILSLTAVLFLQINSLACSCLGDFKRIKSEEDLRNYEFVALVKIISEVSNRSSGATSSEEAMLGFKIIEKYKGPDIGKVVERDVGTSCDMGIEVGDEWVLYATGYNGKVFIHACNRNIRYRSKEGVRDWHYKRGIEEVDDLRTLYGRFPKRPTDGAARQYYPNGKTEIEETYSKGLRNGVRTVYHPNGKIWGKQMFVNDSLEGKSEWFFPSGQLNDQKFYRKDILINKSRIYYDTTITDRMRQFLIRDFYRTEDSLRKTYRRIQVHLEALYDYDGKTVYSREYSRWGNIESEEIYRDESRDFTAIYYHDNGVVRSVQHIKNLRSRGHYQEYDADGHPTKSWDYDEKGKQINVVIPKR